MARVIPSSPVGEVSSETLKVFRLLKQMPDAEYTVWHRLEVTREPAPDFWILRQDGRTLFLSVAADTPKDLQASLQSALLDSPPPSDKIARSLAQAKCDAFEQFAAHAPARLSGAIVFPNLSESEVRHFAMARVSPALRLIGKEILIPERFLPRLAQHLSEPQSDEVVGQFRKSFSPEVVIPARFTVRAPVNRNTQAQLTEYLLDYDQEWVLKNDLGLTREGEATAKEFGVHLVNGVAGSGKSLILLYRAHLLRQIYPDKQILVLTHNRPLIRDLRARYGHLQVQQRARIGAKNSETTEWSTFQGWCFKHWPQTLAWRKPLGQMGRVHILQRAWYSHLKKTAVSVQMLQEEIDWYKDRLLFSREDYLSADRAGRGFALNESTRRQVYDAMETYERELGERRQVDWGDVPRHFWRWMQESPLQLPIYDIILVDEAQFFAPIWFEIIKRLLKPATGHLFLAADPTQGFLQRRQSWLASGLDVRGHSTHLAKSYRTTREILSFATWFYRARLPKDDDEIVAPRWQDMPQGVTPEIIPLTSEQDEMTRVVNEIQVLVKASVPLNHLLVIHANYAGRNRLLERLVATLGQGTAADPGQASNGESIRVCTLNAATGLESPIVFLVGMHELFEREQSIRLSDEERVQVLRDNTRRLYMAMTRAGQRLVLTCVGGVPALFQRMPNEMGL